MTCLTDTRKQFMDGLCGINHRFFGSDALFTHGMVSAVKRMKSCMGQPSLVKVQVGNVAIQHILDGFCVVQNTVISRLGKGQYLGLECAACFSFEQRVGFDFGFNCSRFKLALGNRTNDAEMVSSGLEENRNSAGHDDGVQNGFVAVSVHHHHIPWRYRVVPHNFVGRAGAIGNEKTMVSIENSRCISFTFTNSAVMVKQLSEFLNRIANVGSEHVFAKKLMKHLTHRALKKSNTTRMPRAMP